MKNILLSILVGGIVYSQCDQTNWQDFNPDLQDCNLIGVDFTITGTGLTNTDFSGADLSGANLGGKNLIYANFTNANLTGAILNGVNSAYGTWIGANLTNAFMYDTWCAHADISGANFSGALLDRAWFMYAEADNETNFDGAYMCIAWPTSGGGSLPNDLDWIGTVIDSDCGSYNGGPFEDLNFSYDVYLAYLDVLNYCIPDDGFDGTTDDPVCDLYIDTIWSEWNFGMFFDLNGCSGWTPFMEYVEINGLNESDCLTQQDVDDGYNSGVFDGQESGDISHDGNLNITDIILYIEKILAD